MPEVGIQFEHRLGLLHGTVILTGVIQDRCVIGSNDERQRIQLPRPLALGHCFVEPSLPGKKLGIPLVCGRVLRIELNRPSELVLRPRPVVIIVLFDQGQRCVRLGETVIELQRPQGGGAGCGHQLVLRTYIPRALQAESVGQPRVSPAKIRVFFESPGESNQPPVEILPKSFCSRNSGLSGSCHRPHTMSQAALACLPRRWPPLPTRSAAVRSG